MKSIGEIEENLAEKVEPVLGFKPSSKFKRGRGFSFTSYVQSLLSFR